MGSFSIWHWLIVLVIVLVLFGRGRVSEIMGDFGKGIKSFKDGMSEEEAKKAASGAPQAPAAPPPQIASQQPDVAPTPAQATETKNEQV